MANGLIGHTGTVGKSILDAIDCIEFLYNSSNIHEIDGMRFDVLYVAGISANKWFANANQKKDWESISSLLSHLSSVKATNVVFISTIDIPYFPNEPYSINRRRAEEQMKAMFDDSHIIRLPGLVGKHIKKNFS